MAIQLVGNSHITIPHVPAMNVTRISLCGWTYRLGSGNRETLISRRGQSDYTVGWMLGHRNNAATVEIQTSTGTSSLRPNIGLERNTWTFLAATWDGSTLILYANGSEVGRTTRSGALLFNTNSISIGAVQTTMANYTDYSNSIIDDLRIYGRFLPAEEIETIYWLQGKDFIVDGLIGRYHFNEGAEGTYATQAGSIIDTGQYGLNGNPVNSCMFTGGIVTSYGRSITRG